MSRIRSTFEEQARDEGVETAALTGRLLELDLARQSFRVHTAGDEVETIGYTDSMEQVVRDALNAFVVATVGTNAGQQDLLSLEIIENVMESRFSERRSLDSIVSEQGISPLDDLDALAMPDLVAVPYDEFASFVKALRTKSRNAWRLRLCSTPNPHLSTWSETRYREAVSSHRGVRRSVYVHQHQRHLAGIGGDRAQAPASSDIAC